MYARQLMRPMAWQALLENGKRKWPQDKCGRCAQHNAITGRASAQPAECKHTKPAIVIWPSGADSRPLSRRQIALHLLNGIPIAVFAGRARHR